MVNLPPKRLVRLSGILSSSSKIIIVNCSRVNKVLRNSIQLSLGTCLEAKRYKWLVSLGLWANHEFSESVIVLPPDLSSLQTYTYIPLTPNIWNVKESISAHNSNSVKMSLIPLGSSPLHALLLFLCQLMFFSVYCLQTAVCLCLFTFSLTWL